MKLNIEIDCTPEQFKGIFVPSDKQTDFTAVFFNAMQKSFMKQYFDMGNKTMRKLMKQGSVSIFQEENKIQS